MTNQGNPHNGGYLAAYREVYNLLGIGETPSNGAAVIAAIEILMETLAIKMTDNEFWTLAILFEKTGTRLRDADGSVSIDWWGEMNGCYEDGSCDWRKD